MTGYAILLRSFVVAVMVTGTLSLPVNRSVTAMPIVQYPSEPGPYLTPYKLAEPAPAGLEDFSDFNLEARNRIGDEIQTDADGNVPIKGAVHTTIGDFRFKSGKLIKGIVSWDRIEFATSSIDGISYEFTGHFLEDEEELDGQFVFLKGTLTKYSPGQKIVVATLKLYQATQE